MDNNLQTMSSDIDNIVATFGSDESAFMELLVRRPRLNQKVYLG